jgi:hypothetical protein
MLQVLIFAQALLQLIQLVNHSLFSLALFVPLSLEHLTLCEQRSLALPQILVLALTLPLPLFSPLPRLPELLSLRLHLGKNSLATLLMQKLLLLLVLLQLRRMLNCSPHILSPRFLELF